MKEISFYRACKLLTEAPLAGPATTGAGDPMGGAGMPGGDPMAGAGGMPPGGPPMGGGMGGMGMDPMGGGGAVNAAPVPVQNIPIADVWKLLRGIAEDSKFDTFFEKINVSRHRNPKKVEPTEKMKSLLR